MDSSPRFSLPFLAAGQAQKEWTHNEALQRIEMLLCPTAVAGPIDVPPASPQEGDCYIVGNTPSGVWSGRTRCLAGWSDAGWRFVDPVEGLRARLSPSGEEAVYRQGAWQIGVIDVMEVRVGGVAVVGARRPAIAAPAGGTTIDTEARTAIGAILGTLRAHGLIVT